MTAKEKAVDLIDKFLLTENEYKEHCDHTQAKQCALIAADEALIYSINNCCEHQNRKFWEAVKTEIQKL